MTATTANLPESLQGSNTSAKKRLPLLLITNILFAVFLLAALPIIYQGKQGFAPHADINKEYVNTAISSGQADFMHKALKTTEIARAMAHESHLSTMTLMQVTVGLLAALFFLNSFILFRIHRQSRPVRAYGLDS